MLNKLLGQRKCRLPQGYRGTKRKSAAQDARCLEFNERQVERSRAKRRESQASRALKLYELRFKFNGIDARRD